MSNSPLIAATAPRTRLRQARTAVLGTVLASTTLAGCSLDIAALPAVALGALVPFDACDDALSYLKREAATRVGPYGLDGGGWFAYADGVESDALSSAPTAAAGPQARDSSGGYSGTNNQEAGVDEADMVKTDGEYLYTVVDGTLRVTDVRDGTPAMVGELELVDLEAGGGVAYDSMMYGYGAAQLLLDGDTLLVLMTTPQVWTDDDAARMPSPGWGGWSQSTLIAVDVSDPAAPRETARLSVDGDYLSARMIDGTARVVVRSTPMLPFESPDGYMVPEAWDEDMWREAEAMANVRNRAVVEASTIDQWLPSYTLEIGGTLETGGDESTGQLVPCDRVSHPVDFSGFTTVSVLTIPVNSDGLDVPVASSVLGDGEIVYASTYRLYVVTNRWNAGPVAGGIDFVPPSGTTTTGIHAFDITGTGAATHVASGEVSGRVIGQYAMSEHEGVLRVATTDGDMWMDGAAPSESKITTLGEEDGELVELGSVGGLGKGEQIYAVRYFGETAYVVTFRQTDPLYVLDLSDPTAPRETGELKITGYSAYLHPLGADRLVGVGQEATTDGATIGLQVSLFDTSDPTAPAKIDGEVLRNTYSDAEWDPHAFLSWEATGQLMVPVSGERESGLLVLSVTDEGLTQDGIVEPAEDADLDWYSGPMRTVVVDDRLYTIWWAGVQANDLDTLAPLGWASFS